MPRTFKVPSFYRSPIIGAIKEYRSATDPKKKDLRPSILDFGTVRFAISRHFGFCFGVENAIETAYRTLEEHPNQRIFLVSEMIHNPTVNADLQARGIKFLLDTSGQELIPFSTLTPDDIVIVPAFGVSLEIQNALQEIGINPYTHNATCPFVEKVWKRADELGKKGFAVIIHGKKSHEETRATFSHSKVNAPTLVILDKKEAELVADFIEDKIDRSQFSKYFSNCYSDTFDPIVHLSKIGVINQTTMLASETKEIAEIIKQALCRRYGKNTLTEHYADTRDTLCYATYENQTATQHLMNEELDLAIVVGGYNSSNTSHLVELLEEKTKTIYIKDADEILNKNIIQSYDFRKKSMQTIENWLPLSKNPIIALTSGASCPDKTVDEVLLKILSYFPEHKSPKQVIEDTFSLNIA